MNFEQRTICALLAGSRLYGTNDQNSDLDIRGVIVPTEEYWYGMSNFEQYEVEGEDTIYHEIRKFLRLSAQGNPMFLEMWFSPRVPTFEQNPHWWSVIKTELWHFILSKNLIKPHLGMARAHLARIDKPGKKAGKKGLEAIQKYGYNTKDASHVIRVLHQAQELLSAGSLTFPRPEVELLKDIRNGKYKVEEIHSWEAQLANGIRTSADQSSMRETPDVKVVNKWLIRYIPQILWEMNPRGI